MKGVNKVKYIINLTVGKYSATPNRLVLYLIRKETVRADINKKKSKAAKKSLICGYFFNIIFYKLAVSNQ